MADGIGNSNHVLLWTDVHIAHPALLLKCTPFFCGAGMGTTDGLFENVLRLPRSGEPLELNTKYNSSYYICTSYISNVRSRDSWRHYQTLVDMHPSFHVAQHCGKFPVYPAPAPQRGI